jgi:4-azaleucine resistance transporter AzlC
MVDAIDPDLSRKSEFARGFLDELPILLGVVPFGLIFGALAVHNSIPWTAAMATSTIIFAGSAQFIAVQLIGAGATSAVIIAVVLVVNLRHALYSASVAPYVQHLKPTWKFILSYLLTDEAFAVAIMYYQKKGISAFRHWYFLGAGLTLWSAWQLSTAAGIFIGSEIGQNWLLGFALPLTFIGLVVPGLKDKASVAAAVSAGVVGLLAFSLPYKIGLLLAAFIGILAGVWFEKRRK